MVVTIHAWLRLIAIDQPVDFKRAILKGICRGADLLVCDSSAISYPPGPILADVTQRGGNGAEIFYEIEIDIKRQVVANLWGGKYRDLQLPGGDILDPGCISKTILGHMRGIFQPISCLERCFTNWCPNQNRETPRLLLPRTASKDEQDQNQEKSLLAKKTG